MLSLTPLSRKMREHFFPGLEQSRIFQKTQFSMYYAILLAFAARGSEIVCGNTTLAKPPHSGSSPRGPSRSLAINRIVRFLRITLPKHPRKLWIVLYWIIFPVFLATDAALRLADNTPTADHPGDPGVLPDYHQPHQSQNSGADFRRRHQPGLLPRALGHHAGMLGLLHRDHHPALHHPRPRHGGHRGVASRRRWRRGMPGYGGNVKSYVNTPTDIKRQPLLFQRVIQLFRLGVYRTLSFVLDGCLGVI